MKAMSRLWLAKESSGQLFTRKIRRCSQSNDSWIRVPLHRLRLFGLSLSSRIIEDVQLYGEMHRFIPIYASWSGARVTEIPVEHHARTMANRNTVCPAHQSRLI